MLNCAGLFYGVNSKNVENLHHFAEIDVDFTHHCGISLNMDDRKGNLKSQIEHLRGGLNAFDGDSDTSLKEAIANTEKALHQLEKAVNDQAS